MQNIKYCSSCNKTFTDSNIAFCPFDGTGLIEMQPLQKQQQQPLTVIQSPLIVTPLPATKKKMNPLMLGLLLLGIFFILGALIVSVKYNASKSSGKPTPSPNAAANISKPIVTASNAPLASPTPNQAKTIEPAIIKNRTAKGEQIYKRISVKYGLPVMFGWQGADISLLIPIKEWNNLSKDEQVN